MIRFLLKSVVLVTVLFLGILIGFHEANNGLNKMKGYEDPDFQGAFTVKEMNDGVYETTILGETVSSHNLEEKKKILEEMNTYNLFSDIGKKISSFFSNIAANFFSS